MLPWIVLFTPLVSATIILLFTRRFKSLSAGISIAAVLTSFIGSCLLFAGPDSIGEHRYLWLSAGTFEGVLGLTIDELSKLMLLIVTGIGAAIHIYSLGYMKTDKGKSRYFAGLSLFIFSMLGIVLADNFLMMFLFWELVGVSSYVLIGHWFDKPSAAEASKKAFITNRIGDFGFLLGILFLWAGLGSLNFVELEKTITSGGLSPVFLTTGALLIFCGAVGKSAQFPLHVWLPDAMEGPTPVSALIHAATMVAAGVYMLSRSFFLIEASPTAQTVIAFVGIGTALFAALMATQQDDVKRILAYSTLSQLGYMVAAIGVAAAGAAMFHLSTHACFKALLFLGSGSLIYACHHEQDIWKMGGLKNKMPITFLTFLIGTLALIGVPFLSGFYSKDAILVAAYHHNAPVFWIGIVTAFLTAYYMTRLGVIVFFGKPLSDHAKKAQESPLVMTLPLIFLAILSVIAGYGWFIGRFLHIEHGHVPAIVLISAFTALISGVALGIILYRGKEKDPIVIPLLRNKFYIDELYSWIIRNVQGTICATADFFDRWILDAVIIRGTAGLVWSTGYMLRFFQTGNIQAYAFVFGVGVVAILYYTLFG